MLQIVGETNTDNELDNATDDGIYCAACRTLVTRSRWRASVDGHEHVVFNPAGIVFRILCFREAPGIVDQGEPSDEFTWFKGYQWNFGLCQGCGEHMGWGFTGEGAPALFFGLIKGKLSSLPKSPAED
jgi:hypothetical protein